MKKFLFYLMALPSVFLCVACGDDDDDASGNNGSSSSVTVTVTSLNLTDDGYFDGMMYYKITSNSPQEVTVNKAEKSAVTVEIPSNVNIDGSNYKCTSIAENAFYDCGNLTAVTIPATIKAIGSDAFNRCSNLTTVNISDLLAWCNIKFEGSSSNPLYYHRGHLFLNGKEISGELEIPRNITSIGCAFCGCFGITSVVIPNSVTSIGDEAFRNCGSLVSIDIPNSVTSIGYAAFYGCSSLTSIDIPNGVTSIGYAAFYGCSSLTSIDIPNSVTSIEWHAFEDCSNLTSIYCKATVPPYLDYYSSPFDYNIYSKATLYIPKGTLEVYKSSYGWREFKNIVEE